MGPLDEFKASVAILMAQLNSDIAHVRHSTLVAEQLACREGQEKVEELAQMAMYYLNAVDAAELEEVHRGQRERSESALKGDREHLESALKEEREQNVAMRSCLEELEDENCAALGEVEKRVYVDPLHPNLGASNSQTPNSTMAKTKELSKGPQEDNCRPGSGCEE
ncbi:hypothetical protein AOLI_G00004220 [Acnodon oligacanthus]